MSLAPTPLMAHSCERAVSARQRGAQITLLGAAWTAFRRHRLPRIAAAVCALLHASANYIARRGTVDLSEPAEYALSNDGGVLQLRGHRTALFGAWSGLDGGPRLRLASRRSVLA